MHPAPAHASPTALRGRQVPMQQVSPTQGLSQSPPAHSSEVTQAVPVGSCPLKACRHAAEGLAWTKQFRPTDARQDRAASPSYWMVPRFTASTRVATPELSETETVSPQVWTSGDAPQSTRTAQVAAS